MRDTKKMGRDKREEKIDEKSSRNLYEKLRDIVEEVGEEVGDKVCGAIKKIIPGNNGKESRDRQAALKSDTNISESDMVKRLKILMSIPINSEKYPKNDLNKFLEQIWEERRKDFEAEARRNEFTLYKGRLDLLKQYAHEKNKILLKDCLERMLDNLKNE